MSALTLVTVLAVLLAAAPAAQASFPGTNGLIALDDSGDIPPPEGSGCEMQTCDDPVSGSSAYTTTSRGAHTHKVDVCSGGKLCSAASDPTWSPDGKRLAVTTDQGIAISDLAGRTARILPYPTTTARYSPARWSPDGHSLVATSGHDDRDVRLDIINATTGHVRRLPIRGAQSPTWSSTGWIAYSHLDKSKAGANLWLVRPSGHGLRRLTYSGGFTPDWSPHGTRLVYSALSGTPDHFMDVFALDLRTRQRTRLTRTGGELPVWSPDGRYIAFDRHSCFECAGDIAVMTRAGTGSRTLPLNVVAATTPAWRPQPRR